MANSFQAAGADRGAVSIFANTVDAISYASSQNAYPILYSLRLRHDGTEALEDLELTFEATPGLCRPRAWRIDQLNPNATLEIPTQDRGIEFDGPALESLSEAVRGELVFQLRKGGDVLTESRQPVRFLTRGQWGGLSATPELIAAFALPNAPAVQTIVKAAADALKATGQGGAINGYLSNDRRQVWRIASAVWSAVASRGLAYAVAPASFETVGQKVRTPDRIFDEKLGNCLDLSLLFAAALEQAGLHTLLCFTEGHAFPGVWLKPSEITRAVIDNPERLRAETALGNLVVFEATMATLAQPPAFSAAIEIGESNIALDAEKPFQSAIDIARTRLQGVRPMNEPARLSGRIEAFDPITMVEDAPDLPSGSALLNRGALKSRLELWRRKLLDLTRRNRLLSVPGGDNVLRLVQPDPDAMLRVLRRSAQREAPTPLAGAPREFGSGVPWTSAPMASKRAVAAELAAQHELLADVPDAELQKRLIALYRRARVSSQEIGANTLALAIGMMRWRDRKSGQTAHAPLVLVPVQLKRQGAGGRPTLHLADDDIRFNDTLLELLRQEAGIEIPDIERLLEAGGPTMIAEIFRAVHHAVRALDGFEVEEIAAIASFSFAKYLMWRDLIELEDRVAQNRLIRHLIETPTERYPHAKPLIPLADLDRAFPPQADQTVLPADATQLRAVATASRNQDFVLVGPPGAGKSQTIVNIIAQNMAEGRSVLFVSAKTAALDVVQRRLREVGLGDLCLEIHSSKARKAEVMAQLRRAMETAMTDETRLERDASARDIEQVAALRQELGDFRAALHAPRETGLTAYRAISAGLAARGRQNSVIWRAQRLHDAAELGEMRRILRRIDAVLGVLSPIADHPLRCIEMERWSEGAAAQLLTGARAALKAAPPLRAALAACRAILPAQFLRDRRESVAAAAHLASAVLAPHAAWTRMAFDPELPGLAKEIAAAKAAVAHCRAANDRVAPSYTAAAWTQVNIGKLESSLVASRTAGWPRAGWLRASIETTLRRSARQDVDVARDLPRLAEAWRAAQALRRFASLERRTAGLYAGLATDFDALEAELLRARKLRDAISAAAGDRIEEQNLFKRASAVLAARRAENKPLSSAGAEAAAALVDAQAALSAALERVEAHAGPAIAGSDADWTDTVEDRLRGVVAHAPSLRAWCAWRRLRARALKRDLAPVVEAIEAGALGAGAVADSFEHAFQVWWSARAVDGDAALKRFAPTNHRVAAAEIAEKATAVRVRRRAEIRNACLARRATGNELAADKELGVLSSELERKKGGRSLRELLSAIPETLPKLTPCILMSPMSIAQHLDVAKNVFDVVVFDEASQITTADAIGAIARGRQTIIVGDPKQLPPTSFFDRQEQEADEEEIEEDQESILDECRASNLPTLRLDWHYRSQDESLIAFSNRLYYDGGLITLPSPRPGDRRVTLRRTPGVYEPGAGKRINPTEARAVVDALLARLRSDLKTGAETTYGVITFNTEQQRLIEDLLDEALRADPGLNVKFADEAAEPVVVKNLESIQGDERDVVFFSTTFGRDANGALSMNFGPMNKQGGERRLNVAITRARTQLVVFSSISASDIDLNRTGARGVHDLRRFLDYAERGPEALPTEARQAEVERDRFAETIAEALRGRGWDVDLDLGLSSARVDIAVRGPSSADRYIAAIQCDGPTWAAGPTALDREHTKPTVMSALGWTPRREHLLEWWRDPDGAAERLDAYLGALKAACADPEAPPSDAPDNQLRMVWNAA